MYRVRGSSKASLTSRGSGSSGGGGCSRLRWWAAAGALSLAVLSAFTAVTLWLGFSVTSGGGEARPRDRLAPEPAPGPLEALEGRVEEATPAPGPARPRPRPEPNHRDVAFLSDSREDAASTNWEHPATTPAYEDLSDEDWGQPQGSEESAERREEEHEQEEREDQALLAATGGAREEMTTLPVQVTQRDRAGPLAPRPAPETPTLPFVAEAQPAPTVAPPAPTPPTRFELGVPLAVSEPVHPDPALYRPRDQGLYRRPLPVAAAPPQDRPDQPDQPAVGLGEQLLKEMKETRDRELLRRAEEQPSSSSPPPPAGPGPEAAAALRRQLQQAEQRLQLQQQAWQQHHHQLMSQLRNERRQQSPPGPAWQRLESQLQESRVPSWPQPQPAMQPRWDEAAAAPPEPTPAPEPVPESSFLHQRVGDLVAWLAAEEDQQPAGPAAASGDLRSVLDALNRSIAEGNSSFVLSRLKELYYGPGGELNVTSPSVLSNSSSLVSFGLLAFDLLLLHNLQQVAWGEQLDTGREMLRDPEVAALNALFLDPARVRALADPVLATLDGDESTQERTVLEELMEFVSSALRALLHLGRAYNTSPHTLDCIWTLYCRNLDKTARMRGPYGFLARLNGLGLRLLLGEFPLEGALDAVLREATGGWTGMDCPRLFPRCEVGEATREVLKTAMGPLSYDVGEPRGGPAAGA